MRCARKIEFSLWEYLFSIAGDPKELFVDSLDNGALTTAASYLIIVQTLEPASISSKLQVQLLEKTLEAEEFELCAEIVRYLHSTIAKAESDGSRTGGRNGFVECCVAQISICSLLAISADEEQTVRYHWLSF